jgi:hypothetical protein
MGRECSREAKGRRALRRTLALCQAPCYLPEMRRRSIALWAATACLAAALLALAVLARAPPPHVELSTLQPAPEQEVAPSAQTDPGPTLSGRPAWVAPRAEPGDGALAAASSPAPGPPAERHERDEALPSIPPPRDHRPAPPHDASRHELVRLYGRGDFEAAIDLALDYLEESPDDRLVLRIATAAACILGERHEAAELYVRLDPGDQVVLRSQCERHGVAL